MKIVIGLLIGITSALVGAGASYYLFYRAGAVQVLEYYVDRSEDILTNMKSIEKDVDLKISQMPVENLSLVTITIFNDTNKDFKDLPINIAFDGDSVVIYSYHYKGAYAIDDFVDKQSTVSNGKTIYRLSVNTANRSEAVPILVATFAVAGRVLPNVSMFTMYEGVTTKLSERKSETELVKPDVFYITLSVAAMSILAGSIVLFITFYQKTMLNRQLEFVTSTFEEIKNDPEKFKHFQETWLKAKEKRENDNSN